MHAVRGPPRLEASPLEPLTTGGTTGAPTLNDELDSAPRATVAPSESAFDARFVRGCCDRDVDDDVDVRVGGEGCAAKMLLAFAGALAAAADNSVKRALKIDCDTSLAAVGDGRGIGEPRVSIDAAPDDTPDGATQPPDSTPLL